MPQVIQKPYLNAAQALSSAWPSFLPTLPEGSFLDDVWVAPLELDTGADQVITRGSLLINGNLELGIPGVDAVKLMISAVGGSTYVPLEVQIQPDFAFRMKDVPLALRFSKDLLKPVRRAAATGPGQAVSWEVDTSKDYVDIQFAELDFEINADGDVSLDIEGQINLPPVMLGDSGVVIEARNIGLFLDSNNPPSGQPAGWKGIHIGQANVYLPGELGEIVGALQLTDAYIGNGGFTGSISTTWTPALSADLFGMTFTLNSVGISFVQNALVASSISGTITLPFFETVVPVEIAINLNGAFSVKIGGPANALLSLTKPGLLELELQSLGFEVVDQLFVAKMSGKITPLVGGLDWPGFEVRELSIDSKGHVHLDGGWLDLRDQYSLSFYGFTLEITRFGLGNNDDGTRWIGFSGSMKLVDGFKAGASVKGLKITWGDGVSPSLSFEGVGVEFEVPDVLRFKGEVAYRKLSQGGNDIHRFDGALKLEILCINLVIDAEVVIGSASGPDGDTTFLAIYLGVDLPAGIPLWATGLALYGMAGLFAFNMAPDRQTDEPWYGIGPGEGWYKRPAIGVTDLGSKWTHKKDAFALGAGITIGTLPDNGFTFNGRMLFLLSFPGPVLMIEGKANILKERASLGADPLFRALVVLDFQAGSFLAGIDVRYKFDDAGRVIDIGAGVEMYFSFSDPSAWHLYMGMKEPREKRIRAHILSLFEANSYYMLDAESLAIGAWTGYDKRWDFGPLSITLEAWLDTNAKVSWRPVHFYGDIWAHGKVELKVFGFGLGLSLDAYMEGDVFDPFHILARFKVGINLPWPLPDFSVEIELEWGPEKVWPLPPVPLKELAVEHFKVTASWPLTRDENLLAPVYSNADGLRMDWTSNPAFDTNAPPPAKTPVVPMDCRPHITFSRAMHDKALVGTMVSLVDPAEERIGDPERNEGPLLVKYLLTEVALDAWNGSAWETVARTADSNLPPNPASVEKLYGSWAPTPPLPDGGGQNQGQTKLWLWSKNPFDYVRHGGREWQDWISNHFQDMPCIDIPQQTETCWDFEATGAGALTTTGIPPWNLRVWPHPDEAGLILAWFAPDSPAIKPVDTPDGLVQALCLPNKTGESQGFQGKNILLIVLPEGVNNGVRIHCRDPENVVGMARDADGTWHNAAGGLPADPQMEFLAPNIRLVVLFWFSRMCVWRICRLEGASQAEINEATEIATHNINELQRWQNIGAVLRAHTAYRLLVRTRIEAKAVAPLSPETRNADQVEYAFFQTEGGPGLVDLSVPLGAPDADAISLRNADGAFVHLDGTPAPVTDRTLAGELNDLSLYVRQTLPPTVPRQGEDRPLPKPVYRGYDLGVSFNEDYVSQLFRMDGRDLSLYVYDNNSRPLRDAQGRLIAIHGSWEVGADLILDESEKTWVTTVQKSSCGNIDETTIPHDQAMVAAGLVLLPDFVHQARLTPLLLHETFADEDRYSNGDVASGNGAALGRWVVEDKGSEQNPSHWEIMEVGTPPMRVVAQNSNIHSQPVDPLIPAKPGTVLLLADRADLPGNHPDQPGNWTDYRLSVQMRSSDDDALGIVFRRSTPNRWYRFSMDRERGYRRLVRAVDGFHTILAEDDFTYREDQDYRMVIEAIGPHLAVIQDGERVFQVEDASMDHGSIGLYCWAGSGTRFADIRVDDFRRTARPVYRYDFTTSRYVHFAHQVHSFNDEVWTATLPAAAFNLAVAGAVASNAAVGEDEDRAWTAFAAQTEVAALLGKSEDRTTVTRLKQGNQTRAFLVRCPEPFDWQRVSLTLAQSDEVVPSPQIPGKIKHTGVTRHAVDANEESVSLILREAVCPNGYEIQQKRLPGPMQVEASETCLLEESFDRPGGILYEEVLGENALDRYEIVDQGSQTAPSNWSVNGGAIRQSSNIYGGSFSIGSLPKPGTLAITGSPDWDNISIKLALASGDNDSIGMVFRYLNADNYYRFEMNRQFGYRRLLRVKDGSFTSLWEEPHAYALNQTYALEILAFGDKFYGFLDQTPIFQVRDDSTGRGRVGFYSWANQNCRFEALTVTALEADPLLWQPAFGNLDGFIVTDAPGALQGPSHWQVMAEGVIQTTNIFTSPVDTLQLGTYLLHNRNWEDHTICCRLRSGDNDAMGVMFRVQDGQNYYRFAMDRQRAKRRLIKVVDGASTILWQDNQAYSSGGDYDVTITVRGNNIAVWVNGNNLVNTLDESFRSGKIALYCWADQGVSFTNLMVFDGAVRLGRWRIVDVGLNSAPSNWKLAAGKLRQRSNIWGGSPAPSAADKPGTLAVTGKPEWRNYRFTVDMRADDDDAMGAVVRYVDAQNYYLVALDAQRNYRRLVKVENGVMSILWQAAAGYTPGDVNRLTIDVIGDRISAYLGAAPMFAVNDATHSRGMVGLYCWGNDRVDFQTARVCVPPMDAYALFLEDFQSPGLGAWTTVDMGSAGAPSVWTAGNGELLQTSNIHSAPTSGAHPDKEGTYLLAGDPSWNDVIVRVDLIADDNDAIGLMFRYTDDNNYYRFSMDRERSYRRLVSKEGGSFRVLWEDNAAFETARSYRLTMVAQGERLALFIDDLPVFDVRDFQHGSGRFGLYCWAMAGAHFRKVRVFPIGMLNEQAWLDEDFPVMRNFRWQFTDEGSSNAPSAWDVVAGNLVQTSIISGAELPNFFPGTLAVAHEHDWRDFRVSAAMRSSDAGHMGLVFRHVDAEHYYRLSISSNLGVRLMRRNGSSFNILWSVAENMVLDRDYLLTVDCLGSRITVYINGVERARVVDPQGFDHGTVGLYTSADGGVKFAFIRVDGPRWEPYYRFAGEQILAAGTRLRIRSGSSAEPFTAVPLEENRFVTDPFARGNLRFSDPRVSLRLVHPTEGPQHTASYLPEAGYTSEVFRLLRKADGTAFLIVPPGNGNFARAQRRLSLSYLRDISPLDADAAILSEKGFSDPENTALIIMPE